MKQIYLDHASSMPVDKKIIEYAKPYLSEKFANPSSLYNSGLESKKAIEDSREKIAELINAENKKSIIFTASATESNNIAIEGTALRNITQGKNILPPTSN